MSFVAAGAALVSAGVGIYKAVQGKKAADAAAIEADKARVEMDKQRAAFEQLDTSNPYLGMQNQYADMENTMEDLTVNTQAADFEKQQQMEQQANIMGQMTGAAGSSGIAGLAQAMANEGALAAQKSSAMIGEQEAANQKAASEEASRIQDLEIGEDVRISDLEREGELKSRQMEAQKNQALMALSAGDVSSAQALQQQGMTAMGEGIGQAGAGLTSAVGSFSE